MNSRRAHKLTLSVISFFILVFVINGCKKSSSEPEIPFEESSILLKYLEDNGDYINNGAPSILTAEEIRNAQINNSPSQVIIDLRNPEDFAEGHIEGAIHMGYTGLYDYVRSVDAERIVLVCYGNQTSSYAAALLRLSGINNVYAMKWGMSAWDTKFAEGAWLLHPSSSKKSIFTKTPKEKPAKDTTLPVIHTGKNNPIEILESRVRQLLNEGFTAGRVTVDELFRNHSKYFLVSYIPEKEYLDPGHIINSVNYKPNYDLKSETSLRRLPPDSPIVFYCSTGQISGYAAAYLRLLGYNAKFLIYGTSTMIYDELKEKNLDVFSSDDINNYPYVK